MSLLYVKKGTMVFYRGKMVEVKDCFAKPDKSRWPERVKTIVQIKTPVPKLTDFCTCVPIDEITLRDTK